MIVSKKMSNLTHNLLNWYSKNKRQFPWRVKRTLKTLIMYG